MAAKIRPDLVIVGDDAALQRVGSKLAQQGVPVIYLGINNNPRNYFPGAAPRVSGVLERPLILRSVFELGKAVKGLRSALVLFDDDLTSRIIRDETFVGRDSMLLANIHVDLALTGSYAEWQRRVQGAAGRYQAIWVGLYFTLRGADGKVVPETRCCAGPPPTPSCPCSRSGISPWAGQGRRRPGAVGLRAGQGGGQDGRAGVVSAAAGRQPVPGDAVGRALCFQPQRAGARRCGTAGAAATTGALA